MFISIGKAIDTCALRSTLGPLGASYDTIDTVRLGNEAPTRASA
jgi:hypothetical protein